MDYHTHATGVTAGPELTAELRRLADLFLVSSVTPALFLLRTAAEALAVTFVLRPAAVARGVALLAGWAASLIPGVRTTSRARRWGRVVLCAGEAREAHGRSARGPR